MITSLIWKDLRLNGPVLLAGAMLLVTPYVCAFAWMHVMAIGTFPWAKTILIGSYGSQWLSLLTASLLGGNAIACEREDESDSFLASLPARRGDIVFSKLTVSFLALESLWIINPLVSRVTSRVGELSYAAAIPDAVSMSTIAALAVMVFGFSWTWSTLVIRPVTAALGGLLTCGLVYAAGVALRKYLSLGEGSMFAEALPTCALLLGLGGVALGAAMYRPHHVSLLRATSRSGIPRTRGVASRGAHGGVLTRKPMVALLWKDARLLSVALAMGLGLLMLPYLIAAINTSSVKDGTEGYAYAAMQSLWASCLVLPLWGGYVIAAERASGSGQFLSYLPASPGGVISSKLLVSLFPSMVVLFANVVLTIRLHEAIYFHPIATPVDETFYTMTWSTLISQRSSLLFSLPVLGAPAVSYGVAWFFAARLEQPLLGIVMGMISAAGVLLVWLAFYATVEERLGPVPAASGFAAGACAFGALAVLLGSRSLLRGARV